jgi:hypothetical protein
VDILISKNKLLENIKKLSLEELNELTSAALSIKNRRFSVCELDQLELATLQAPKPKSPR